MAKTIEQLKAQGAEVKNATVVGENTATRVGTLFNDIVEHVEDYEAKQAEKLADFVAIKEQNLSDSEKLIALNNISALGYCGSIGDGDLNSTTWQKGIWYFSDNTSNAPFKKNGLLTVLGIGNIIEQRCVNLRDGTEYTRIYNNGWTEWLSTWESFKMYKGSLSDNVNIDTILTEGVNYFLYTSSIQGVLPSELQYNESCLLSVDSVGFNYTKQLLTGLNSNCQYYRTYVSSWTDWKKVIDASDLSEFATKKDTAIIYKNIYDFTIPSVPVETKSQLIASDGTIVTSGIKTYYYTVKEGDTINCKTDGIFSSSGFSVVSLWNDDAFVKSMVNSPLTGGIDLVFNIPNGVNRVACSYFVNSIYIGQKRLSKDSLIEGFPNILQVSAKSNTVNGVTFTVNDDKTITATGTATGKNAIFLIGSVIVKKGQYWICGTPTDTGDTKCTIRLTFASGGYKDLYQGKDVRYLVDITNNEDTINVYALVGSEYTCPDNITYRPMIIPVGTYVRGYVPYGTAYNYGKLGSLVAYNLPWAGKKICGKGDSIMAGASGNWLNVVSERLGLASVKNYGIGGSRMAYYGDGKSVTADMSVVATWDEMDVDADIIYIHAGTNDWASQVPLGESTSTNKLEFNGALNIIMSGLRAKYPTALIVFNTILPRVDYDAETHGGTPMSIKTSEYSQAIKDRCRDHHIVCNDIYNSCGLDFEYDYKNGIYSTTNDGLHPNIGGAEILGRKIAGFISTH